jgi:hypothetical protein
LREPAIYHYVTKSGHQVPPWLSPVPTKALSIELPPEWVAESKQAIAKLDPTSTSTKHHLSISIQGLLARGRAIE